MHVQSFAKVNLYLKIGKKQKSGYHALESVMQFVQLHDSMRFEKTAAGITVESNNPDLRDENNLAYKAALLLKEKYKVNKGVHIYVEKNIPISAGLGGGSSNAAYTLVTLNKLWGLKLTQAQLMKLGMALGSDVPFFIGGNAALVQGIGDKVKPLKKSNSLNIVLVNPGIKVETKKAYADLDRQKKRPESKAKIKDLIKALEAKEIKKLSQNIHNDFDELTQKKYPIIKEIKTNMRRNDALSTVVTGSGPTVLGVFESIYTAREAYFKLKDLYPFVYLTKTF